MARAVTGVAVRVAVANVRDTTRPGGFKLLRRARKRRLLGMRSRRALLPSLLKLEVGYERLCAADAIRGGAHDSACVTGAFSARIEARVLLGVAAAVAYDGDGRA